MIDTIQDKKEISKKLKERAIFEGFTIAGIASVSYTHLRAHET